MAATPAASVGATQRDTHGESQCGAVYWRREASQQQPRHPDSGFPGLGASERISSSRERHREGQTHELKLKYDECECRTFPRNKCEVQGARATYIDTEGYSSHSKEPRALFKVTRAHTIFHDTR